MSAVKVFISYSWSSTDHEDWVLQLATELRENGVDAILDKWDLKEGNEANAFMEKMVTDPEISKVVIVSDKLYTEKSDARAGGAGTEAQIISSEIFSKQDQSKFVVVARELKDDGSPYLPAYYTSRIFIDFTDSNEFGASFDKLLRWIANVPINKKPELGSLPKYISEPENAVFLATGAVKRRAIEGLRNATKFSYAATNEYFDKFLSELEKFRLPSDIAPESEGFLENFQSFLPYRDEYLEIVRAISDYTVEPKYIELIHTFFERFHEFSYPPKSFTSYSDIDFDNFKFFVGELFLHTCATLIAAQRFEAFNHLVSTPYYSAYWAERSADAMISFAEFRKHLRSLEIRKQRLELNRVSLSADFLHDRAGILVTDFRKLMEVDFLLHLRSKQTPIIDGLPWHPDTLVYLGNNQRAFEIFERSRSRQYFEKIRPLLGNVTKEGFCELIENLSATPIKFPGSYYSPINPVTLTGVQRLCTLP